MIAADIELFSRSRTKARAYFCYLFSKNIPNRLPSLTQEMILPRLRKIKADLENCEGVYLLDAKGVQVSATFAEGKELTEDIGKIRADRAYYYRAVREERCSITDPYPSLITGRLTVTASVPIFSETGELKYVACIDMPFEEVLKIAQMSKRDIFFARLFKLSYAVFAFTLMGISLLLFLNAIQDFFTSKIGIHILAIDAMFKATILLTLSLAIFDLAKTLVEEEVLGQHKEHNISGPHKTMVKFLGSIIIALSIESLMLVFKFAITDPERLILAILIAGGVALLLISLAIYIKFTKSKQYRDEQW